MSEFTFIPFLQQSVQREDMSFGQHQRFHRDLHSGELELSLTQPLLKGFGIDNNKKDIYIANNDLRISRYDFESKVIDTISEVENVYWDLVLSIEDFRVKQKSLERAQDFESRVRAQVEVGTVAPLEILQAQAEVASREELLLTSSNLIEDTEDNLKNILNIDFSGSDGNKKIQPMDRPQFDPNDTNSLAKNIPLAFKNRPDYLSRKKALESQNILVSYNENQLYPSVDLFGSLGLNGISGDAQGGTSRFEGGYGTALSEAFGTEFFLWELGLKLSYPIGNRSAKSRLAASRLESAKLLMDIKDLEKTIVVEVVESHGCNSKHKVGDKLYFDGAGNLLTGRCPEKTCVYALSASLILAMATSTMS